MEKFILILKTSTKINGLIQIYKKKSDEQNRFTYYATSPKDLIKYSTRKLTQDYGLDIYNSLSLIAGVFIFKDDVISIEPSVMEFWDLLVHNTISVILIILSGIFTFGIFGNFILISNGLILARIVVGVNNNYGIGPIVKHIMPHFLSED